MCNLSVTENPITYHLTPADEAALQDGRRAGQDTAAVLTARYPYMRGRAWALMGDRRLQIGAPLWRGRFDDRLVCPVCAATARFDSPTAAVRCGNCGWHVTLT